MEIIPEIFYRKWRQKLWNKVKGGRVLEIGVGTGKNIEYYPENINISAIDLTPGMLIFAQNKVTSLGLEVDLQVGDAQNIDYPSNTFDVVVATFVFCSVPDAVLGLQEARRVLKPGGKLLLLEHVRSKSLLIGKMMDLFNPLMLKLMGLNINRDTIDNVKKAGFEIEESENIGFYDIYKFIIAK